MNNRVIKFRAWNNSKAVQSMLYWSHLKQVPFQELGQKHLVLMQFTGLHDKNGKEIYEGDVITCYAIQREIHDVIEHGTKVVVKYQDGYFYPFGYNAGWRSEVADMEVLGNIYENPELINPQKGK